MTEGFNFHDLLAKPFARLKPILEHTPLPGLREQQPGWVLGL